MQTIQISLKDSLTKSVSISGYISPLSNHTRLVVGGVSLGDLSKLQPFTEYMMSGFNAAAFDLNHLCYSILD